MARLFDDTTPDYLSNSSAPVTAYPMTMAAWFYVDEDGSNNGIVNINEASGDDDYFALNARMDRGGDPLEVRVEIAGSGDNTRTDNTISINTWSHGVGIFTSATDRRAVLNGDWANSGANTDSLTPGTPDYIQIGNLQDGGVERSFSGRIAEVAVWNVALIQVEVEQLSRGISPLRIRPGNLVGYWPIFGIGSPEPDYIGANNMTLNGSPVVADHPPVMPPFGFDLVWQGAFTEVVVGANVPTGTIYGPLYGPLRGPI